MKRGLAALDRKASKQSKSDESGRTLVSEKRKSLGSNVSGADSTRSQLGQQLSKALALQLKLCTDGKTASKNLDSILRQIFTTNTAWSSQNEAAIRAKFVDKTVSLLPARLSNSTSTRPSMPLRQRNPYLKSSWIQQLKKEIIDDPSKASSIQEVLSDAWQSYASSLAQQVGAGTGVDLLPKISLVGAPVVVTAACDPRAVGAQGTCLWDSSCNIHVLLSNHPAGIHKCASFAKQAVVFSVALPAVLASRLGRASVEHVGAYCTRAAIQADPLAVASV